MFRRVLVASEDAELRRLMHKEARALGCEVLSLRVAEEAAFEGSVCAAANWSAVRDGRGDALLGAALHTHASLLWVADEPLGEDQAFAVRCQAQGVETLGVPASSPLHRRAQWPVALRLADRYGEERACGTWQLDTRGSFARQSDDTAAATLVLGPRPATPVLDALLVTLMREAGLAPRQLLQLAARVPLAGLPPVST